MSQQTADQFLMGGGIQSAKFEVIGDSITGEVLDTEVRQQTDLTDGKLKFWDDGRPQMQLVVTIQTTLRDDSDDDGQRRVYVKGKSLTEAVREAVKASGARGLEVGGKLMVQYVGDGEQTKRGFNPPKQYAARYQRPNMSAAANQFLGTGNAASPLSGVPQSAEPPF